MRESVWRRVCRPIIAKVLSENRNREEKEIRAELRKAYPFGERARYPYKIWLEEVQRALRKISANKPYHERKDEPDPRQERLL